MTNFYEDYKIKYANATPEKRKACRDYWEKIHAENYKKDRYDLIIMSAQILDSIAYAEKYLIH